MIGQTLGSYRVVGQLGAGGMGVVYVAEHPLLGRKAAIKMLLPEFSKDQEFVSRFFNEAKAVTLIRHPGLVDIFDFGYHADGSAFIAMELLEGESLGARLKRERVLAPDLVVAIMRQVASAVGAAHDKGIVHRDLKPDNIFLVPDRDAPFHVRIKILDFGIAKLHTSEGGGAVGAVGSMTRTGAMLGTPYYMSPEQCRGAGQVDARSDIYAVGCIMYEMLAGRPPHLGEGVGEVIAAHIYVAPTDLAALAPHVPPTLAAIVMRLLSKSPADRPRTLDEVSAALAAASGSAVMPAAGPLSAQAYAQTAMAASAAGGQLPGATPPVYVAPGYAPAPASTAVPVAAAAASAVQPALAHSMGTLGRGAGEVAPRQPAPAPGGKRTGLLVVLGLLAAAGVAAAVFFGTRGKSTSSSTSSSTSPSTSSSTSPSTSPSPSPSPDPLATARQALTASKWAEALGKAMQVLDKDAANPDALAIKAQAELELGAQPVFDELERQAEASDWAGVIETYQRLPATSVYRERAGSRLRAAEQAVRDAKASRGKPSPSPSRSPVASTAPTPTPAPSASPTPSPTGFDKVAACQKVIRKALALIRNDPNLRGQLASWRAELQANRDECERAITPAQLACAQRASTIYDLGKCE
ncbi:MAG: serine/threonine protein kinase [Deltaproteobacteria bacterium]|nr:serine/threonine protein kinase [Deltaproteobacteria bacterium]